MLWGARTSRLDRAGVPLRTPDQHRHGDQRLVHDEQARVSLQLQYGFSIGIAAVSHGLTLFMTNVATGRLRKICSRRGGPRVYHSSMAPPLRQEAITLGRQTMKATLRTVQPTISQDL